MLGGASIVGWACACIWGLFPSAYGVEGHVKSLPMTLGFLSLFVNFPHFMASYHLAYRRGFAFIQKHWIQLVFVPVALGLVLFYLGSESLNPLQRQQARQNLGLTVLFMYFTVGWHYSKQAFGCVMTYAAYSKYAMDNFQRELFRYAILSTWWCRFCYDSKGGESEFFGLHFSIWPAMPEWTYYASLALSICFQLVLFYKVFLANWRQGRRPHPNMLVPYLAILVWTLPIFLLNENCFVIVPFFHSLQYLTFVYRLEEADHESEPGNSAVPLHTGFYFLALVFAGWLGFQALPGNLDAYLGNSKQLGFSYFLVAFNLFINIHHYFLDNALWKIREDPVVSKALFGPRTHKLSAN